MDLFRFGRINSLIISYLAEKIQKHNTEFATQKTTFPSASSDCTWLHDISIAFYHTHMCGEVCCCDRVLCVQQHEAPIILMMVIRVYQSCA